MSDFLGTGYVERMKEIKAQFFELKIDEAVNLEVARVIGRRCVDLEGFTRTFFAEIFNVSNQRISSFCRGDWYDCAKHSKKIATYFIKLDSDKELHSKCKDLFVDRPRNNRTPRRRSKSVPRATSSSYNLPELAAWFNVGYKIITSTLAKNTNAIQRNTNPFVVDCNGTFTQVNRTAITNPFMVDGYDTYTQGNSKVITNPFMVDYYDRAEGNTNAQGTSNPFLLDVGVGTINENSNGSRNVTKAKTPEPDKMPPNYQVSTISRIMKTKLPVKLNVRKR